MPAKFQVLRNVPKHIAVRFSPHCCCYYCYYFDVGPLKGSAKGRRRPGQEPICFLEDWPELYGSLARSCRTLVVYNNHLNDKRIGYQEALYIQTEWHAQLGKKYLLVALYR